MPVFGCSSRPGAAAAAFDEVLDGMAARHDGGEVVHEHDGVQRAAAEAAANEERAALAQEAPDHRQVQIDAGGDVRNGVALPEDRVRQQQVVHVAAMAGHVDDLVILRELLERLDVLEHHAVVEPVPQPREHELHEAHERVRIVRGDFFRDSSAPAASPAGA